MLNHFTTSPDRGFARDGPGGLAAPRGFEPRFTDPKSAVLPLDEGAAGPSGGVWSGRRDSNPRPSPWQGDALPTEPLPLGDSTTSIGGAESQIRTGDTAIFSRVLYQLSYLGPMANQARLPVGGPQNTTDLSRRATRQGPGWSLRRAWNISVSDLDWSGPALDPKGPSAREWNPTGADQTRNSPASVPAGPSSRVRNM